jgi:ribonuclease BN (tRNA processing enzyme)
MEVVILGSGTGVPTAKRSAPGLVVKIEGKPVLFDSGSGVIYQLPKAGIDYYEIDHIFYTHIFHPDHVNDLAAILFANKYNSPRRKKTLNITGPRGVENFYKNIQKLFPIFKEMPFKVNIREVRDDQIRLNSISIISKPLFHQRVDCVGYRVEFRGKVVVYTGDTSYCVNLIGLAKSADLLISECSFPEEFKVEGHLFPRLAGKIATEARVKKLLLTHLYPPCDDYDIKREVKKVFQGEVILAEDLMKVEV